MPSRPRRPRRVRRLGVLKGWGWNDPERLNVNGSGISLGQGVAAIFERA